MDEKTVLVPNHDNDRRVGKKRLNKGQPNKPVERNTDKTSMEAGKMSGIP